MSIAEQAAGTTTVTQVNQLKGYGVKIPKPITEAIAKLGDIKALTPNIAVAEDDLVRAFETLDTQQINAAAINVATGQARKKAWTQARDNLGLEARAALRAHAEALIADLGKAAQTYIAKANTAAALPHHDIGALLRDGHTDDAQSIATLPHDIDTLAAMYQLRDRLSRGIKWGRDDGLRTWRNPTKVRMNPDRVDLFIGSIRNGAELWWPTPAEARARDQELQDQWEQRQIETAKDMAARGQLNGFGDLNLTGPRR